MRNPAVTKPRLWLLSILLAGLLPLCGAHDGVAYAAPELNAGDLAPARVAETNGRVIVRFRKESALLREHSLAGAVVPGEVRTLANARAKSLGLRLGRELQAGRMLDSHTQVIVSGALSSEELARMLAGENDVEYAVVDHRRFATSLPDDPLLLAGEPISGRRGGPELGQWYLRAPDLSLVSGINAFGAWDLVRGSSAVVVAVLDSGVRAEHPDLAGVLLSGYDMISDAARANDGDGRDVDPNDPGDWVTRDETLDRSGHFFGCRESASSWHGTRTASLIGAAANDGVGMAGVAFGVRVLPVRVIGKCGGHDSDIIAGIRWAAGLPVPGLPLNPYPARVINLSLGGIGACTFPFLEALSAVSSKESPAVVVASAGNNTGRAVGAPASCRGVIAVGALRHAGTKVGYSDLGPEVAISAPGGNCVRTEAGQPCQYAMLAATNSGVQRAEASSYTDSFNANIGTSNSAPLVSGTVALMFSAWRKLRAADVREILQRSARAFPAVDPDVIDPVPECRAPSATDQLECRCTASTCGAGMLDADAAVAEVLRRQRECFFDWAETAYPGLLSPHAETRFDGTYQYRHYAATGVYLGVSRRAGRLYYLAAEAPVDLGPMAGWLAFAGCD